MDEPTAAAAVVATSVDDFAEEDLEQYVPHGAAAVDEPHRPAEEAAEAQEANDSGSTVPSEPEIANPKVTNAPIMPLRTRCRPPII